MSVKGLLYLILPVLLAAPGRADSRGGLTEGQYHEVIDQFLERFRPEADRLGLQVKVSRLWSDETVNAWVRLDKKVVTITTYGGLARHKEMTPDALALVLCEEIGAVTGGTPRVRPGYWIVHTGQRDYYSTLKCLRRVFNDDDNAAIVAKLQVDPLVKRRCERQFTKANDQLICQRSSMAGLQTALLLHAMNPMGRQVPSFATPDPGQTDGEGRPILTPQCRLDTFFAGAVCHVDVNVPVSDTDERQGVCNEDQDDFGVRPRCWYKPVNGIR